MLPPVATLVDELAVRAEERLDELIALIVSGGLEEASLGKHYDWAIERIEASLEAR